MGGGGRATLLAAIATDGEAIHFERFLALKLRVIIVSKKDCTSEICVLRPLFWCRKLRRTIFTGFAAHLRHRTGPESAYDKVRVRHGTVCTRVTPKVTESASPRAATRRVAREPPAAVIGGGCIECELRCLCKRPYAAMCGRQTARVSAVCSHALRDCQTLTLLSAGPTPP